MKPTQALELYIELMDRHGLIAEGWNPVIDNAKSRLGCCKYSKKQLTLSKYFLPHVSEEDIKDTMLHEIAHALVGTGHGHDYIWKLKAKEIGAKPVRCGGHKVKDRTQLKYKWTGTCPNGHKFNRHKLTKKSRTGSCPHCSDRFDPKYMLNWAKNY